MIFFLKLLFLSQLIAEEELGTVDVIGSSPLPGIMIDRKNVPNTTQKINESDIKENLTKTITDLMNENFSTKIYHFYTIFFFLQIF